MFYFFGLIFDGIVICFIAGAVLYYLRGIDYSTMGIVKYLKAADFTFYMQITDDNWHPLKDEKGALLPAVKVSFSSDKVEGSTLMEGAKIIMKGHAWRDKSKPIEAEKIWNLSG